MTDARTTEPATTEAPPCSLDPVALAARVDAWRRLSHALVSAARTPTGAELAYRPDPGVAERLLALVEAEAACCPDLRLDVAVVLRVDAPERMREWVGDTFVPG